MSLAERKYMRQIDEMILHASDSELEKLQELDLKTQMQGANFYDVMSKSSKTDSVLTSDLTSIEKREKH